MRYVQINSRGDVWADSIIFSKHRELQAQGYESWVFWARGEHEQDEHMQKIASYPEVCLDALLTRIDGRAGFHSRGITRRLLKKLDEIDPDVVHLHVLLGYYINVRMLFEWLASHRCQVVWTLHDCWAFTGHCIHFTYVKCMQWRTRCAAYTSCPQKRTYPEAWFGGDRSVGWSFDEKKRLFAMLPPERMRLITPSKWLADLVKQSFLSKYDVEVVHNTVDTSVFRPTPSDFRERYGIGDRFMVLGVASKWSERKGLKDFVRLARDLDSERFAIVVVGLNEKQIKKLQKDLIALPRTESAEKLAEAYSAADVFVHPGVEETSGMTVAEAQACDTAVVMIRGSACEEAAGGRNAFAVSPDLSDLEATIVELEGGGRVILLARTKTTHQLAAIYTAADVFFNPTREDNYPTVNIESESCGTTVVTFETGGCPETVNLRESCVARSFEEASRMIRELAITDITRSRIQHVLRRVGDVEC